MKIKIPDKETLKSMLKTAFGREKVICRIIAAWCTFVLIKLMGEGDYSELAFAQKTSLTEMLLLTLLFFVIFSVVAFLLPRFYTDSWFLLAAATVCVVFWLKYDRNATNNFLTMLAILLAYCLFMLYVLQRNEIILKRWQPDKRVTLIFAIVCGVGCATVISVITCMRYLTFTSPNFDFGLFCNMFHYMKETGLPFCTSERDMLLSHFAVHISPIYYVLLPFYFIFPSPITLQIGQALILASGVIPVWLLCRKFSISGKTTLLTCLIYSLYPAISCGTFYDIHENCFLLPLLLWMFYFFEKEKYIPMYAFMVAVLLVKEDAAIYIIIFAIFVILSRKKYLHGSIIALAGVGYFLLASFLLEKYGMGIMATRFGNLIFNSEDGLVGAIKTTLFNPGFVLTQMFTTGASNFEKLIYFVQLFLPLGLIPFCTKKPSRWLLLTPVLMNFFTYYQYQYNINFQYHFGITAFLFYALIMNLPELHAPTRKTLISIGAAATCFMYLTMVIPKYTSYTERYEDDKAVYTQMEEILDSVPKEASVSASTMLIAHMSDRDTIYEVAYHSNKPDVNLVVLDMRPGYAQESKQYIHAYMMQGYTVYAEYGDMITILISPDYTW